MSTNFNLTTASPAVNVIQSINYLLATQGASTSANANVIIGNNVVQANTITGQVYTNGLGTISYIYGYIDVKYSNSASGSTGFTSNSTLANYYGVYNNKTGIESSNPVDYQWTQVVGGFGTTKGLYYTTGGGNTISFFAGATAPTVNYTAVPDNTPILLATLANSIVVGNSISPATITNVAIASNTIQGQNIQLGTITANLLAANIIFVNQSIQSTNATFDSYTSAGFWLDASTGNSRFGGSVNIGNNLTVGQNAVIGTNLNVGSSATIGDNLIVGNNLNVGTSATIGDSLSIGNNATIGNNLNVNGLVTAGSLQANTVNTPNIVLNAVTSSNYTKSKVGTV